ncbi:MAG TPA: hypothetical protein VN783_06835 [Thermoanaerobaculia bacterium]|nr:hypothetical protein [Thermoanaerobaculia bacterium]
MRTKLLPAVFAVCLLASGCKDNFDVMIPGNGALICIKIKAKNAQTQQDLTSQIQSVNPQPTAYERRTGEDSGGFNVWILKVQLPFLAGQTGPRKVHIGIELKDGAEWERVETVIADQNQPTPPNVSVGSGRSAATLSVENPSPSVPLRLDKLDVAIAPVDVPLVDLNYNDPLVASFDWQAVIAETVVLAPGEVRVFDLPDALVGKAGNRFLRALYTDAAGGLGPLGVVQQGAGPTIEIPLLSPLGIALLALLLSAAALLVRRGRRQSVSGGSAEPG